MSWWLAVPLAMLILAAGFFAVGFVGVGLVAMFERLPEMVRRGASLAWAVILWVSFFSMLGYFVYLLAGRLAS